MYESDDELPSLDEIVEKKITIKKIVDNPKVRAYSKILDAPEGDVFDIDCLDMSTRKKKKVVKKVTIGGNAKCELPLSMVVFAMFNAGSGYYEAAIVVEYQSLDSFFVLYNPSTNKIKKLKRKKIVTVDDSNFKTIKVKEMPCFMVHDPKRLDEDLNAINWAEDFNFDDAKQNDTIDKGPFSASDFEFILDWVVKKFNLLRSSSQLRNNALGEALIRLANARFPHISISQCKKWIFNQEYPIEEEDIWREAMTFSSEINCTPVYRSDVSILDYVRGIRKRSPYIIMREIEKLYNKKEIASHSVLVEINK